LSHDRLQNPGLIPADRASAAIVRSLRGRQGD
jgi:hypothetical protein